MIRLFVSPVQAATVTPPQTVVGTTGANGLQGPQEINRIGGKCWSNWRGWPDRCDRITRDRPAQIGPQVPVGLTGPQGIQGLVGPTGATGNGWFAYSRNRAFREYYRWKFDSKT